MRVCAQLPDCCVSYSNIQAKGLSLPTVNLVTAASPLYTPQAPSPPGYTPTGARCNAGPCINTCCTLGPAGFCQDNLLAQGGHYAPGEAQAHSMHMEALCPHTPSCIEMRSKPILSCLRIVLLDICWKGICRVSVMTQTVWSYCSLLGCGNVKRCRVG